METPEHSNTRSHPFLDRLRVRPVLADGGMGTLLYQRGFSFERCFDELCLSEPDVIRRIHQDYISAGAELIETNTFGGNRVRLGTSGFGAQAVAINARAAKLAREAREIEGRDVYVAGSIGPLGKNLAPLGPITARVARDAFSEQVEGLLEGGVDLFIVETMSDLDECALAIAAVRRHSQLPLIASVTFTADGVTMTGRDPETVAGFLGEADVDLIGLNCSVGPQGMLEVAQPLHRATSLPLSIMPNAGMPTLVDGRFVYRTTPEYMAGFIPAFVGFGARVVGGCCGTTPSHTAAMAGALAVLSTPREPHVTVVTHGVDEGIDVPTPDEGKSRFASGLGKQFQVSIELDPPRGTRAAKVLKGARLCLERGIEFVNVADSPMARVRMGAIAMAALIEREVGLETILHFTCRDRNLMGLQSDSIGAHALGIRNILAITGDPPSVGDFPGATGVYDVDAIGFVSILSELNQGRDFSGTSIGRPTEFAIGVAVNPVADDLDHEIERLHQKIENGAMYAFTQPLYRLDVAERFLRSTEDVEIPVFLGLLPLMSYRHGYFLHHEVPGIEIPEEILERMKAGGDDGARVGVATCRELLRQAKAEFAGVYLMPSFGRYETCIDVVAGLVDGVAEVEPARMETR